MLSLELMMPVQLDAVQAALNQAIALIQTSGTIAPAQVAITPYAVVKTKKDGSKVQYQYFKVEADRAIFEGDRGGKTKYLHLGKQGSEKYQDWRGRVARRNIVSAITWAIEELAVLEAYSAESQEAD